MSIEQLVYVICDGCDLRVDAPAGKTRTEARRNAKDVGAHVERTGGTDICPDCWEGGYRG